MNKEALRERVWDELDESGEARFPFPPHGRIPNFAGADAAAERLAETQAWTSADTVKANPDAPQLPVRRRALREGKTVYMAVPRLRDEKPFYELDPVEIPPDEYDSAPTVSHVEEYARQVGPDEMDPVDLIVSGSVAVTAAGARIGKGEGYSDLEFTVLREFGLVDDGTVTATTVHERQVVEESVPVVAHDVPMDLVVTPDRIVETNAPEPRDSSGAERDEQSKPVRIAWDELDAEQFAEIPILRQLDGED
ncbi:5-formyltetrahydrofolate cyclo-ligase [Halorussus litoreus]|uniref:5-formyltetrahydrofolate cyclo-ligase n=1 Tax=Halorussus litoreus TaxID=1710536 RepID=UPI000E275EBC|nr:5-formyltetrahydrofolate cyclo-ligase [Halorussus litoreus]